jgi:aryl-alcohol dehydrogenase-like predicted oxidoreductase
MRYRRLGHSGLEVSEIGLGTYLLVGDRLSFEESHELVNRAFDLGVNLFDTADTYGDGQCEEHLGQILREHRRSDYLIATKCFFPVAPRPNNGGLSRKHIFDSVHGSLRRLGLDYIDLMQCHRYDPHTPLEETARALDDLRRQGKILYWGMTRWTTEQIESLISMVRYLGVGGPSSHQTLLSLANRTEEAAVLTQAKQWGLGILAHSPLAQGVLTGKYNQSGGEESGRLKDSEARKSMYHLADGTIARATRLKALADSVGATAAQLALGWCLNVPGISSVLVGSRSPQQLEQNIGCLTRELDATMLNRLDTLFPTA